MVFLLIPIRPLGGKPYIIRNNYWYDPWMDNGFNWTDPDTINEYQPIELNDLINRILIRTSDGYALFTPGEGYVVLAGKHDSEVFDYTLLLVSPESPRPEIQINLANVYCKPLKEVVIQFDQPDLNGYDLFETFFSNCSNSLIAFSDDLLLGRNDPPGCHLTGYHPLTGESASFNMLTQLDQVNSLDTINWKPEMKLKLITPEGIAEPYWLVGNDLVTLDLSYVPFQDKLTYRNYIEDTPDSSSWFDLVRNSPTYMVRNGREFALIVYLNLEYVILARSMYLDTRIESAEQVYIPDVSRGLSGYKRFAPFNRVPLIRQNIVGKNLSQLTNDIFDLSRMTI